MTSPSLPNSVQILLDGHIQLSMQLNLIPKGSFLMGSRGYYGTEEPVHLVEIPYDFYMGVYPVTQQQYAVWTEHAVINHENSFSGDGMRPAENMSWLEASQYSTWLTAQLARQLQNQPELAPTDFEVRLPTEAQWEYACSAWLNTAPDIDPLQRIYLDYYSGDGAGALDHAGWYQENSQGKTQAVGQKQANRHGLFDMHGNVFEWCEDEWESNAYRYRVHGTKAAIASENNQEDEGDRSIALRVLRGGSWFGPATGCRAASRSRSNPDFRDRFLGFRVGLFPVRSYQQES